MGQCVSVLPGRRASRFCPGSAEQQQHEGPCELDRLPHQLFISILLRLEQQDLLQTVPRVCKAWRVSALEAMDRLTLNLSSEERQQHLPDLFSWLQQHGQQLKQLQLSTSTPLGRACRKTLLQCLVGGINCSGDHACQQQQHSSSSRDQNSREQYHSGRCESQKQLLGPGSIHSLTNNTSWDLSTWGTAAAAASDTHHTEDRTASINSSSSRRDTNTIDIAPSSCWHSPESSADTLHPLPTPLRHSSSNAPPSTPCTNLQLQQLALQMDLDVWDLQYLTRAVVGRAPHLHTLKLQPLKPSLADLQLLVLACIVGNLVGADAPAPVLPHLSGCGSAVSALASRATQLRSLSLSRYDLASVTCVTGASQLTSLALQCCSLQDSGLKGLGQLTRLRRLDLSDNNVTAAGLPEMTSLQGLTHLDVSVMPSRSRMRSAYMCDISPLTALTALAELNLVGFGAADVSPLRGLGLHTLELGLNPLDGGSLRTLGRITSLRHLELAGVSQALMMSSGLNLTSILSQQHNASWCGLTGLQGLTALDLGGSHFSASVWASHMCHLLAGMTDLQRLMLAHCSIPPGKMQYLLPGLSTHLVDLNIDRCPVSGDELLGLARLTHLTRLSAAAMAPELDNKQAALLTHLTSLKHLVVRSNAIGHKGALSLAKALTGLTCLDLANNPIGRRASRQLAPLMAPAEVGSMADTDSRCW